MRFLQFCDAGRGRADREVRRVHFIAAIILIVTILATMIFWQTLGLLTTIIAIALIYMFLLVIESPSA